MPKFLNLIIVFAIFHYYKYYLRIIDIYYSELEYWINEFIETIYYNSNRLFISQNNRITDSVI